MELELKEIKYLRKKLGLSQKELADKAGVSQSLIAKVESNKIEPTYSKCVRIFNVLKQLTVTKEYSCKEIMRKKIITVREDENILDIIRIMKKNEISQVPVMRGNSPIGLVTESVILEKMVELNNKDKLSNLQAKDVMSECPPIVSPDTKQSAVLGILRYFPVILIGEKGQIIGLITKSDIIELIK